MERAPLDREQLGRGLQGTLWTRVEVRERTASTNADVAAAARQGSPEGLVVTAEHQVAGRGRLTRSWQAPARSGLAVSMLVRPAEVPAASWPWLPLLTGVAVATAISAAAGVEARVKWPNDLLVDEHKVAGILVERVETPTGSAAVIGIGVNVDLRAEELPVPQATSLALAGAGVDRTALLVEVLRALSRQYESWRANGGDPAYGLRTAYANACTTLGRRIRAELPDGTAVVGLASGVDDSGRLLVHTGSGFKALGAGDVVHLRSGS